MIPAGRTSSFNWKATLDIGEIGKLLAEREGKLEMRNTEKSAKAAHAFHTPGTRLLVVFKKTTDDEKGQT